jgi:hypothetical protein
MITRTDANPACTQACPPSPPTPSHPHTCEKYTWSTTLPAGPLLARTPVTLTTLALLRGAGPACSSALKIVGWLYDRPKPKGKSGDVGSVTYALALGAPRAYSRGGGG